MPSPDLRGRFDRLGRAGRDLDERVVPRLARALAQAQVRARALRRTPRLGAPLRLVRDVPQLAAFAAAVLLVAGAVVVLVAGDRDGGEEASGHGAPDAAFVGPAEGQQVEGYVEAARSRLESWASDGDSAQTYAVVQLAGYRTPAEAALLIGDLEPVRVFFRVPLPGVDTRVHLASVGALSELGKAFEAEAAVLERAGREFAALAKSITTGSEQEAEFKRSYEQEARNLAAEGRELRAECACVFSIVVRGSLARLAALQDQPEVRVVDPAPVGTSLSGLTFGPLRPEVTGTVTTSPSAMTALPDGGPVRPGPGDAL